MTFSNRDRITSQRTHLSLSENSLESSRDDMTCISLQNTDSTELLRITTEWIQLGLTTLHREAYQDSSTASPVS